MVDKTDSIRIKIFFDYDEKSEEKIRETTKKVEQEDQRRSVGGKNTKKEKFGPPTEEEYKKILKKQKNDVRKIIRNMGKDPETVNSLKKDLDLLEMKKQVKEIESGAMGQFSKLSSSQTKNLMSLVSNPGKFVVSSLGKYLGKYGRAARVGIYGVIALLVYQITMFTIDEMMKPGRPLDRRFKRIAQIETMNFYDRLLQEEIYHGYQDVRVTTISGLRGGASQVNGGFFQFSIGTTGLTSSASRSSHEVHQISSNRADARGNPTRPTISGRFR